MPIACSSRFCARAASSRSGDGPGDDEKLQSSTTVQVRSTCRVLPELGDVQLHTCPGPSRPARPRPGGWPPAGDAPRPGASLAQDPASWTSAGRCPPPAGLPRLRDRLARDLLDWSAPPARGTARPGELVHGAGRGRGLAGRGRLAVMAGAGAAQQSACPCGADVAWRCRTAGLSPPRWRRCVRVFGERLQARVLPHQVDEPWAWRSASAFSCPARSACDLPAPPVVACSPSPDCAPASRPCATMATVSPPGAGRRRLPRSAASYWPGSPPELRGEPRRFGWSARG